MDPEPDEVLVAGQVREPNARLSAALICPFTQLRSRTTSAVLRTPPTTAATAKPVPTDGASRSTTRRATATASSEALSAPPSSAP